MDYEPLIGQIVDRYVAELEDMQLLGDRFAAIFDHSSLRGILHSFKWRLKDPEHLREKLRRKATLATQAVPFDIRPENLFTKVNDLIGVRLIHLHTTQFPLIDSTLRQRLNAYPYKVTEGPVARVWDNQTREFFEKHGIATESPKKPGSMYTSVHYVVDLDTRDPRTAEIQVRTLAEELWGEVDHSINYPDASTNPICHDQLEVLARLASACSRLVDSIFAAEASGPPAP